MRDRLFRGSLERDELNDILLSREPKNLLTKNSM